MSRCKACNSPHRAEIDGRLLNGEAARAVAVWLEQTHGEKIHFSGLTDHKNKHLNVLGEVKERLKDAEAEARALREAARDERAEAEPAFEEAVQQKLGEVDVIDEIIAMAMRVGRSAQRTILSGALPDGSGPAAPGEDFVSPDVSSALVGLFTGSLKAAKDAVVAKHEMLEGKSVNVNAVGGPCIYIPPEGDD